VAIIKCPFCKRRISDNVHQCPHCYGPIRGAPPRDRNKNKTGKSIGRLILQLIVYALVFAFMFYSFKSSNDVGLSTWILAGVAALVAVAMTIQWTSKD